MNSLPKSKPITLSKRVFISLAAASPYILLQFVFLLDSYQWTVYLFGYMGIFSAAVIVLLGWCFYCFAEYRFRIKAQNSPVPSFSIAGGVLLIAFFLPAMIINPIALKIPSLCRVTQSVEWSTSKSNSERNSNHSFILVLIGKGTQDNHQFTTGYMNWTGKESAGFTSIDLEPISFQEQYYENYIPGKVDYLKSRMANSGIPDDELKRIVTDVWDLLNLAGNGLDIHAKVGIVKSIYSHVDDQWDYIIGGWIWIFTTLFVFIFVGWRTVGVHTP